MKQQVNYSLIFRSTYSTQSNLCPVPFRATVQTLLDVLVEIENLVPSNRYVLKVSGREEYLLDDSLILPSYTVSS